MSAEEMNEQHLIQTHFATGFDLLSKLQDIMKLLQQTTTDLIANVQNEKEQVSLAQEQKMMEKEKQLENLQTELQHCVTQNQVSTIEFQALLSQKEIDFDNKKQHLKKFFREKIEKIGQIYEDQEANFHATKEKLVQDILTSLDKEAFVTAQISQALKGACGVVCSTFHEEFKDGPFYEDFQSATNEYNDAVKLLTEQKINEFDGLVKKIEQIKAVFAEKKSCLEKNVSDLQEKINSERMLLSSCRELQEKMITAMTAMSRNQIEQMSSQETKLAELDTCVSKLYEGFQKLKFQVTSQFGIFEESFPDKHRYAADNCQHGGTISLGRESDSEADLPVPCNKEVDEVVVSFDDVLRKLKAQKCLWKFCFPFVINNIPGNLVSVVSVKNIGAFVEFLLAQDFFKTSFLQNDRVSWQSFVESVVQFELKERKCSPNNLQDLQEYIAEMVKIFTDARKRVQTGKRALSVLEDPIGTNKQTRFV